MKSKDAAVSRFESWAAIAIFAGVVIAGIYRLFFGISVADEAQYTAFTYFPTIGARWFVDDYTIQLTSAILVSPFVTVYAFFFGTEALTLYTRLLYLTSATATALLTAKFLSRFCRWTVALVLGSVLVAYVPFGMACLNYNTMGSQYFGVAAILSLMGLMDGRRSYSFWGGVFWVLCVFSYPTAMITFFIFSAIITVLFYKKKNWLKGFVKPFFLGLIAPSVILVGVLLWLGIGNIQKAVELSRTVNMPFQAYKILFGLELLSTYLPPWWLVGLILTSWVALIIVRPQWSFLGFVAFLLAYIFMGGKSEGAFGSILWPMTEVLILIVAAQHWRQMNEFSRVVVIGFVVPAICGSIVAWMTSRMTIYNMHGTAIFAAVGTVALAAQRARVAGWSLALILLTFTLKTQFTQSYEDDPPAKLSYTVASGPFRFLHTNPRKGEVIETLQKDLKTLPEYGSILFKDHFPAGFLMTSLRPRGPYINILPAFIHFRERGGYYNLFQNKDYFTDYVVEFRYFPMSEENWYYMDVDPENPTQELFKQDPFHNFFMKSGEYQVILDRGVYRILKRIIGR